MSPAVLECGRMTLHVQASHLRFRMLGALMAVVLAGCTGSGSTTGATSSSTPIATAAPVVSTQPSVSPTVSGPVGVAVLGHSGATGFNSDPDHPGEDAEANSWATGTNPEVQSIYLRTLAADSNVQGHATNLAIHGTDVNGLIRQATDLVSRTPAPRLILVMTVDNDIRCDGTDSANFDQYKAKLTQALQMLATGLPDSQIFVVSQVGTVKAWDKVVFALDPDALSGDGPCDTVDATTGKIVPAREAYLQGLADHYWSIVTTVCGQFPTCRTDGNVLGQLDIVAADLSSDNSHLSIAGLAKVAAAEWAALNH